MRLYELLNDPRDASTTPEAPPSINTISLPRICCYEPLGTTNEYSMQQQTSSCDNLKVLKALPRGIHGQNSGATMRGSLHDDLENAL